VAHIEDKTLKQEIRVDMRSSRNPSILTEFKKEIRIKTQPSQHFLTVHVHLLRTATTETKEQKQKYKANTKHFEYRIESHGPRGATLS
jgi:hypothetical protein